MTLHRLLRRVAHWQRHSTALLMLLVQVGVAIAPLVERDGRQAVNHAEQRGTRHARMHNESTCAVCSVRSLQASVSATQGTTAVHGAPRHMPIAFVGIVTVRDPPTSNTSRAPPSLS